jgi:hypothetical protein
MIGRGEIKTLRPRLCATGGRFDIGRELDGDGHDAFENSVTGSRSDKENPPDCTSR